MNKAKAIERLAKAVAEEAINKAYGDIWADNWNPEAHVQITLTIDELRCASFLSSPGRAKAWWLNPPKRKAGLL